MDERGLGTQVSHVFETEISAVVTGDLGVQPAI